MKKSSRKELTPEQIEKLVSLALEERNPFEIIKKEFGLAEKEVLDIMKKKMPLEKFEMWKKKAIANKPKPKPIKIDDFDEDLDGKYYIKNKLD
ncbi:TIGR03643 family protein [Flavobacterium sp. SH_e]|uniref:TIGR03643 family protein n=1 Tax=Flavobacterium TaxID=237 RepID=UPI0021E4B244|nr:TIGR03643 family protein [Flavobacterium sp. SH_e]MCV2487179.1 TIGR03643 family protein [Flavobacterium sp. SH_e]